MYPYYQVMPVGINSVIPSNKVRSDINHTSLEKALFCSLVLLAKTMKQHD